MAANLDFFFFYGSNHSYLSVMRIETLAAAAKVDVRWRPFNLREILIEQNNTGFVKNEVKMSYFWHDIERRAARHNISYSGRVQHPVDPDLLAFRVGVLAADEGWCPEYSRATFHDWFIGKHAPGVGDHVEKVLTSMGRQPEPIIAKAKTPATDELIKRVTDEARKLGIFGAPTFAIGKEIFWGDDRLEEALDFASKS
jgi:2-hydroxychromene-2-carboxylate isomerase